MNNLIKWLVAKFITWFLVRQGITNKETRGDVQKAVTDLLINPPQDNQTPIVTYKPKQPTPSHFDGTPTHLH